MKLKEFKEWIETLPNEFLEFDVVNGELGILNEEKELTYRIDKPVTALTVDEENKEIVILNNSKD